ncbi:MAG: dTDP-4-dehydrorhamnose 3,5-epimerase [Lachnospiraceae bacterium]|nr:dTDP-4-dehydrorhamnose 3,5-epimerase [Lachnospiraceae bacterium]
MNIISNPFSEVKVLKKSRHNDERGYFERIFCEDEFKKMGITDTFPQINLSYNCKKGTLRGLHFQKEPYAESKVVQCLKGCIYDVIVDLRQNEPTYLNCYSVKLSENEDNMIYVPRGFAHGFQTLEDDCIVLYYMGEKYNADFQDGINCFSPKLNIDWPLQNQLIISEKDRKLKNV